MHYEVDVVLEVQVANANLRAGEFESKRSFLAVQISCVAAIVYFTMRCFRGLFPCSFC